MQTEKIDQKYLGRDTAPEEIEIVRQKDSYLFDSTGKKHVDFVMGWCVGNFGWNNTDIKKRLQKFSGPDYVTPHYIYRPWAELARRLERIAPGNLKKSFRATGGTEAVDIALQAAMNFTKRQKFISIEDAYHGDSIAARSIGSPDFGNWYKNSLSAYRIKSPLDLKSAEQAVQRLKKRDIAAVIMEPVVCNRGVLIPTDEFMQTLAAACKKYGTLLIMDEVATGFGRTGKMFAGEHYGISPDIMCLGKAITGGYAPMGAVLTTDEVAKAMKYESSFYSTYGWHPYSVEAALSVLDYLDENFSELKANTLEMSNYIVERLMMLEWQHEAFVRFKGLAINVSFADEDYATGIVDKAKEKGLMISESDGGFSMFPALNVTRAVVNEAFAILEECI